MRRIFIVFATTLAAFLLAACSKSTPDKGADAFVLDVFKTPTCGCCGEWVAHIENAGLSTRVHDQDSLNDIKAKYDIPAELQSCHTGVSKDGYFFEGHIPAKFVQQFLASPPKDARGLAVPAMPLGSPGMEMGDRFTPYVIYLVNNDGSQSIYARVETMAEQHL